VIWEPFVLALFLGLIVSAGLYYAYLWPSVEPEEPAPAGPVAAMAPIASIAPIGPIDEPPVEADA